MKVTPRIRKYCFAGRNDFVELVVILTPARDHAFCTTQVGSATKRCSSSPTTALPKGRSGNWAPHAGSGE